jgi:hypothetical protein
LHPEIVKTANEHENGALQIIPTVDKEALRIYNANPGEVKEYLTNWSELFAARMFKKWKELDEYLLIKFMDGNIKAQNPDGSFKDNGHGKGIPANPQYGGYTQKFLEAIAADPAAAITAVPKAAPADSVTEQ